MSLRFRIPILIVAALALNLPGEARSPAPEGRSQEKSKEVEKLERHAQELDQEARNTEKQDRVYEKLSEELSVPVATLKKQRERTGFGFGQIFIANALAKESGKSFDQVAGEFRSGKGWGRIAKENDVKLGRIVSDMKRSTRSLEKDRRDKLEHVRGRREPEPGHGTIGTNRRGDHGRGSAGSSSRARRRGH